MKTRKDIFYDREYSQLTDEDKSLIPVHVLDELRNRKSEPDKNLWFRRKVYENGKLLKDFTGISSSKKAHQIDMSGLD